MDEEIVSPAFYAAAPPRPSPTFYVRRGKRTLDVLLASTGLVVGSPLMLLCAAAICLSSPGPVFFRQTRVGQLGRKFHILKFRTMIPGADRQGLNLTISNDPRVTPVGRLLRKSKLDELPQLINVLRGEMSLVGPRPETPDHVAVYNQVQREVLAVRPGITGRASLAFINEEEILAQALDAERAYLTLILPQKLRHELVYCRRITLRGDLTLIFNTVLRLLMQGDKEGSTI